MYKPGVKVLSRQLKHTIYSASTVNNPAHSQDPHRLNYQLQTYKMWFSIKIIAATAAATVLGQSATASLANEARTSCNPQLPIAGPFKLELIPAKTPDAADPVGLVRAGPSIDKLAIMPNDDQLFTYNTGDRRLYKVGEPGLGNWELNSDRALTFSKDPDHDGGLAQQFDENCEIFLIQATDATSVRDTWYVGEDDSVLFAPKGNSKRTSGLHIKPVSLPGN